MSEIDLIKERLERDNPDFRVENYYNQDVRFLLAALAEKEKEWVGIATEEMNKCAALTARNKELEEALEKIIHEIGVPQPGYIQPVANAYGIAKAALKEGYENTDL